MICEECKSCPIKVLCDKVDTIIDENLSLDGEHDILMAIYEKGRADVIAEIHTELITEIAMLNATDMTDTNLYTFAIRIKEITDRLIIK